jgi:hypothetical protein
LRSAQGAAAAAAAISYGASLSGPKKGYSRGGPQQERNLHEDRWQASAKEAHALQSSSAGGGNSTARIGGGMRTLSEITLNVPIR